MYHSAKTIHLADVASWMNEKHPEGELISVHSIDTHNISIIWKDKEPHPNKNVILSDLQVLRDSCSEGLSGDWDCSTPEGREAFNDMIQIIDNILSTLEN